MKKRLITLQIVAMALLCGTFVSSCCSNCKERPLVILSTNDMHANIDMMPRLAEAIRLCRDTADVILVDAGDKWTGNAYVDMAEDYAPMYELMNHLGYDVSIYGNHEFDNGQATLARAEKQAKFVSVAANTHSDTTSFPTPTPYYIVERGGVRIKFVGVVGNHAGDNLPAGKVESFKGLHFTEPFAAAAEQSSKEGVDALILLSHMGIEYDIPFAESEYSKNYDMVVSAHSHSLIDTIVNGVVIGQTINKLQNLGATTVRKTENGIELDYRNVPLKNYAENKKVAKMVAKYKSNPKLLEGVAKTASEMNHNALVNLFAEAVRKATKADIGLYNRGGVRIAQILQGDVSIADIFNAEPFGSHIATVEMSVPQLRAFIMEKYNDKVNVGEAKQIDIIMTTPYEIQCGADGYALDVKFPELNARGKYSVAMGDYIFGKYKGIPTSKGGVGELLVTDALIEELTLEEVYAPNNNVLATENKK